MRDGEVNVRQGDKTLINDFIRGQNNNNKHLQLARLSDDESVHIVENGDRQCGRDVTL